MSGNAMFKSATMFRLLPGVLDLSTLGETLSNAAFVPCSAESAESCGWVESVPNAGLAGCQIDGQVMLTLKVESKVVPGSALKAEVAKRVTEIEGREARKVGRKEKKELTEAVLEGLLLRALPSYKSVRAWLDTNDGWLVVESGSAKMTDMVLGTLHKSINNAFCAPVKTKEAPSAAMATWLSTGEPPAEFTVDMDCSLKGAEGQTVRFAKHSLDGQIEQHLKEGKVPVALGMTFRDRASFVLTEDGKLKKLTFMDALIAAHREESASETADAEAKADLVFMGGELRGLLPALVGILGGVAE